MLACQQGAVALGSALPAGPGSTYGYAGWRRGVASVASFLSNHCDLPTTRMLETAMVAVCIYHSRVACPAGTSGRLSATRFAGSGWVTPLWAHARSGHSPLWDPGVMADPNQSATELRVAYRPSQPWTTARRTPFLYPSVAPSTTIRLLGADGIYHRPLLHPPRPCSSLDGGPAYILGPFHLTPKQSSQCLNQPARPYTSMGWFQENRSTMSTMPAWKLRQRRRLTTCRGSTA